MRTGAEATRRVPPQPPARRCVIAAVPGVVVGRRRGRRVRRASVSPSSGVVAGVVVGLVLSVGAVAWGDRASLVRAARGAPGHDEDDCARVDNLVDGLCATMGLEPPDVLVVDEWARQALALGPPERCRGARGHVGPAASRSTPCELEGVLAHELVHVKRADIAPATMAAAVLLPAGGGLARVGDWSTPSAGRGREFRTDRLAVAVTRYPAGTARGARPHGRGPAPRPPSPLARRGVARATRWLWTVALPESPGRRTSMRWDVAGELDAPAVRIAALDEW